MYCKTHNCTQYSQCVVLIRAEQRGRIDLSRDAPVPQSRSLRGGSGLAAPTPDTQQAAPAPAWRTPGGDSAGRGRFRRAVPRPRPAAVAKGRSLPGGGSGRRGGADWAPSAPGWGWERRGRQRVPGGAEPHWAAPRGVLGEGAVPATAPRPSSGQDV